MMKVDVSRRSFLRGQIRGRANAIHPPWSTIDFIEQCQRCDDCVVACQEHILVRGDGGFPVVDFALGECTFCRACVNACHHDALDPLQQKPWSYVAAINEHCLSSNGIVCRACGDSCDQHAIHFRLQTGGRSTPEIFNSLCNGCGACLGVCPAKAIKMEEAA